MDQKVVLFFFFFFRNYHTVFYTELNQSVFPPTVYKDSLFSISSATLVTCLFDASHSNRCEVIPHGGFDLHFPDDQ